MYLAHRAAAGCPCCACCGILQRRVRLFGAAHVPVGDQLLAVGIGLNAEHDVVVEEAHGLGIGAADHLVDHFHELLRAHRLAGVQSAVDPDHGLALAASWCACSSVTPSACARRCGDLLVVVEILDIVGRGDDGHPLIAALLGLADVDQLHAIGFGGELLPVGFELGVVGDHVVVAEIEPERFLGGGDLRRGLGEEGSGRQRCRENEHPTKNPARLHVCTSPVLLASSLKLAATSRKQSENRGHAGGPQQTSMAVRRRKTSREISPRGLPISY